MLRLTRQVVQEHLKIPESRKVFSYMAESIAIYGTRIGLNRLPDMQ